MTVVAAVGPVRRLPGSDEAQAQHSPRTGHAWHVRCIAFHRADSSGYPRLGASTSGSNNWAWPTQLAPRRSALPRRIWHMRPTRSWLGGLTGADRSQRREAARPSPSVARTDARTLQADGASRPWRCHEIVRADQSSQWWLPRPGLFYWSLCCPWLVVFRSLFLGLVRLPGAKDPGPDPQADLLTCVR